MRKLLSYPRRALSGIASNAAPTLTNSFIETLIYAEYRLVQ